MKRRTIGELIFWGAAVVGLVLYFLTMPNGLPWKASVVENRLWQYLVAMAGGSATTLTCLAAAGAAGLLGALVNRYLGWRVGIAAAIMWIFLPGVWNGAIVGERGVVMASAIVAATWMANAVGLWVTRKARVVQRSVPTGAGMVGGDILGAPSVHEVEAKRGKVNRIAGWVLLGAAGLFAGVSISMHDYQLGEAASAYARLVVEEAGERIILMNGLCDEQIVEEVKKKGEGEQRRALSLKDTEENRMNVVAFAKFAFPSETNLWLEAEVSPTSFAEAAVKKHPERFYMMQGQSTTPEMWAARWEAMKPYLASRDRFIPAMRQAFAYEGNVLGNRILEEEAKVKGEGEQWKKGEGEQWNDSTFTSSAAKQAWGIYLCVFTEIHPKNPAACVNLNEMLRRGYKVDAATRQRIESAQADYAKLMKNKRKAMQVAQYISHFGPVMRDQKAYEELRERIRKQMEALEKKGEKPAFTIPDLKTLEEWHREMMKSFWARDIDKAVRIARAILSRKVWRTFIPANMVLGEKMMMEGHWAEAEIFLRVAVNGKGAAAPPPLVLNDYAETLRQLKRYDEAEKYARKAVAMTKAENGWIYRLTLAQILRDAGKKMKVKVEGRGQEEVKVEGQGQEEVKALVKEVLKNAPKEMQETIKKEFPQ